MDLIGIIRKRKDQQVQQAENLINPPKLDTSEKSVGFYRSIGLDVVTVAAAALFGFSYYRYITHGLSAWILFAALLFYAGTTVMQVFLAKKNLRRFFLLLLETAALLVFFVEDDPRILTITCVIVLAMMSWGYFSAHALFKNGIEIPFFGVSGSVLGKFTTGILLFMILIYVPQIGGNALVVSSQGFQSLFDWTANLVQGFYPDLSLNGTFGNFAQSFTTMELKNNPSFQTLSGAQQQEAIQQETAQFTNSFLQNSSGTVASSTPASDAFYNVLNGVLGAWQSQSSGWFDIGWVTVLFIGLRSLGVIFVIIAQFVSLIFYEILLASGFMKVSEESHGIEVIKY